MRVYLLAVIGTLPILALAKAQQEAVTADEQTLAAVGLATDGRALLEFFRFRARLEPDHEHLLELTQQLGDAAPERRARAVAELIGRGAMAVPALRHAINDLADSNIANRARQCLKAVEGNSAAAIPAAAARLLAVRKPTGAAEALLAYLPFADDALVTEAVSAALTTLAYGSGKPDPALLSALRDPVPLRRAVAGEALCRKDQPDQWPEIRKLLADPKASVRLRAALALANQQDVAAIPVLIDLLAVLTPEQRKQAEDVLHSLAGEWSPQITLMREDDISRRIRRDAWASWWRNTDGPALIAEFRKRTLTPEGQAKIEVLIQDLGNVVFQSREKASTELVAYGHLAVPALREASSSADLEVKRRAEACLRLIAANPANVLPAAAPRLLALRKPVGAMETLLAYLPSAEDMSAGEVQSALTSLSLRDGKPDPLLVQTLQDKSPLRRAAAAEALIRGVGVGAAPLVRKLLGDENPLVRMRAALVLMEAKEKEAVPVLIDAVANLNAEASLAALDALLTLAGDKAPADPPGADAESRRKFREAWSSWWKSNAAGIDLSKLQSAERFLGYTLLVEVDNQGHGKVRELDRAGNQRWVIEGLQYPVDAWVIGGNRVLIAEYSGMRVTERDLHGKVLWEKAGLHGRATNVQRLVNGNTVISSDQEVTEVDHGGKNVFSKNFRGQFNIVAAYKARNGEYVVLTGQGTCLRVDGTGKELRSFNAGRDGSWTSGLDLTSDGRILITQPNTNRVQLFDPEGKGLWEAAAPAAVTATWLPNGHVLTASYNNNSAVELDRTGNTVWQFKSTSHIYRARRR
jgi:HEAT repeat protein